MCIALARNASNGWNDIPIVFASHWRALQPDGHDGLFTVA